MKIIKQILAITLFITSAFSCKQKTEQEKQLEEISKILGNSIIVDKNEKSSNDPFGGSFKLNQEGHINEYYITVTELIDNDIIVNDILPPDPGKKYVTIKVKYRNPESSNCQIEPNPWMFKIVDSEGETYNISLIGRDNNIINTGIIRSGENAKGSVSFLVPDTFIPYKIKFRPFNEYGQDLSESMDFLLK